MNGIDRIKKTINDVCKKECINYHTYTNIDKLGSLYLELKVIIGEIKEIEEQHGLKYYEKFEQIVNELDKVDHEIINMAQILKIKK
jgi:hypothetical protein